MTYMERIFYSAEDTAMIYCYSEKNKLVRVLYNGVEVISFSAELDIRFTERMILSYLDFCCGLMISAVHNLKHSMEHMKYLGQFDLCTDFAKELMEKEDRDYAEFVANGGKADWED